LLACLAGGWSLGMAQAQKDKDEKNVQQPNGFFHTASLNVANTIVRTAFRRRKNASEKLSSCIYTKVETHKKAV
jgi:hypothetical protein